MALQDELDSLWTTSDLVDVEKRYEEVLNFVRGAGLLRVPVGELTREPLANLVHILQTEIAAGRVRTRAEAQSSPRLIADGYVHICKITSLDVQDQRRFSGAITVKSDLGGEVVEFTDDTKPYEISVGSVGMGAKGQTSR